MNLKLTNIPVFYINLDTETEKRNRIEKLLIDCKFTDITRLRAIHHEKGRAVGCARSHYEILSKQEPPFIILEDDVCLNKDFVSNIQVPNNADALYLGISHWGRYLNHSGPYVHTVPITDSIVRVYNMLATHAILYLSDTYVDICKRIAFHHGYVIEDHIDIGFAEVQKYYNVYALNQPLFRQYEWSAVTTGKLTENSYGILESKELFQEVLTNDQNYYKMNETFKSPIRPLLEKRDINGIPGYYLPTKIL
jgi:hypothetical protein